MICTTFLRVAFFAVGLSLAPLTTSRLSASFITDTAKLQVVGIGVGQPGNFNINLSSSAVVGPGTEFLFRFPQFDLAVDIGASDFELRFVRTGSFGDLTGPLTWTLSDLDWIGAPLQISSISQLPPSFASQLAVQSFQVIDGHTIQVTTGPTGPHLSANQNAHFQLELSPAAQSVPEPSSLALCCCGVASYCTYWWGRRRFRRG